MAEINHPPVDYDLLVDTDFKAQFAKEVFQLITMYGDPKRVAFGEWKTDLPITDWAELDTTSGEEMVMRICGVPVMAVDAEQGQNSLLGGLEPSDSFFVAELQTATIDPDTEVPIPEEEDWQPYVTVIVNTTDTSEIHVVDSRNGQDLSQVDIMQAGFVLDRVSQEFRNMHFADEIAAVAEMNANSVRNETDAAEDDEFANDCARYGEFDVADFILPTDGDKN